MDLLLDINVAVDVCTQRPPFYQDADLALAKCLYEGGRLWLYAGSVQTLEYVTRQELQQRPPPDAPPLSAKQRARQARNLLKAFAADKHWLAALAGEGDVFDSDDPEDEQLIRALDRFQPGVIKLLTRDQGLLDAYPDKTISPARYCQLPMENPLLAFIDLQSQQNAIRPALEERMHWVLHHGQYIMGPEIAELEAVLLAKWPHFAEDVAARGRIGARYTEQLQEVCVTPQVRLGNTHVYAQYTIRVAERDRVAEALKAQGIPTAVYYPKCLHEQPVFAELGYQWGDFPEAERASREVLSLPMHPGLTEREQDRVVECVARAL